jgi:hypothetical protein
MSILRRENKKRSPLATLLLMLAEPHLQFGPVRANSRQQARYLLQNLRQCVASDATGAWRFSSQHCPSFGNNVVSFRSEHAPVSDLLMFTGSL